MEFSLGLQTRNRTKPAPCHLARGTPAPGFTTRATRVPPHRDGALCRGGGGRRSEALSRLAWSDHSHRGSLPPLSTTAQLLDRALREEEEEVVVVVAAAAAVVVLEMNGCR